MDFYGQPIALLLWYTKLAIAAQKREDERETEHWKRACLQEMDRMKRGLEVRRSFTHLKLYD